MYLYLYLDIYLYLYYLNPAQWGLTACVVHMVITPQFASNRKQFRDQCGKFLKRGVNFSIERGKLARGKKDKFCANLVLLCITITELIIARTLIVHIVN